MSAGALLLKKLINVADTAEAVSVLKRGMRADFFEKPLQPLATYLINHYGDGNGIIDEQTLTTIRPELLECLEDFAEVPAADPSIIYDAVLSDAARSGMRNFAENMAEKYADEGQSGFDLMDYTEEYLTKLNAVFAPTRDGSRAFGDMVDDLLEDMERACNQEFLGYPVPINCIQKQINGFEPGQLTTVVAKSGAGKTFFLIMAAEAALYGDPYRWDMPLGAEPWDEERKAKSRTKVLFVSFEMSTMDIARRLAAVLSKVSFGRLRSGRLDADEKETYKKYLEKIRPGGEDDGVLIGDNIKILGPESVSSPLQIEAQAKDFDAGMVILDGFYLMDGSGEKRWEKVQENMRQIRLNSLRSGRHYLLSSQLSAEAKTHKSTSIDSPAFSSSIAHDSNNVIFMIKESKEPYIDFSLGKARDGAIIEPYRYTWDWLNMRVQEQGPALSDTATVSQNNFSL